MNSEDIVENGHIYSVWRNKYGDIFWHLNGNLHREDGPAIEYGYGDKLHRENGPAIEYANGYKEWHINGKYHREDGPAIERADGIKEWWLNNKKLPITTNEQFKRIIKLKVFL